MNIKEDILNILKLIFGIFFFAMLGIYLERGEFNYSMLREMIYIMIDFFIPYQLPVLVFFYFLYKYNIKGNK